RSLKLGNFCPRSRMRVTSGLLLRLHLFTTRNSPTAVKHMPVMLFSPLSSQRGMMYLIFMPLMIPLDRLTSSSPSTSLVKSLNPSRSTTDLLVTSFVMTHSFSLHHFARIIPNPIDQNPWAHWRSPMDMMRQG